MINLFEYQNKIDVQSSFDGLEGFLDEIWNSREKNLFYSDNANDNIDSQQFLQFIHKSNQIKSNKYIGVIHYEGTLVSG
jgi:5-methylcytosine-specific restriction enzyme subunit McrC